jgi:type I restriction enzyme S subunit
VAEVLSAYDDLIENNLRRIAILEEMARAIYREWFVEFRYPGRGSEPLVESQAGPIPRDWQSGPIGSLVETTGGGTPSTSRPEYWEDGDITWYTPSDLTANDAMFITRSSRRITELGLRGSSAKLFPPYSVMMTSRATIGVVSIATTEACTNQGFITCIPNDSISSYHLYFWLLENQQTIASFASGATFKEISRTVFRRLPIAVPPKDVAKAFVKVVDPVAKLVEVLLKQDLVLRNTRDLLLPRLISGELDVSNITIDAEEDHL